MPGPDRPGPDRVAEFRAEGRTLFSLALVKGSEGNLSVFDGRTLVITRSGVSLAEIEPADLVVGALGADLPGASVDLEEHRRLYGRRGPGAIVHAHPPGTVPEGAAGPGAHGVYAYADELEAAVEEVVRSTRRDVGRTRR